MINKFKKIVIKIGSSSIVNEKLKKLKLLGFILYAMILSDMHPNQKIIIVCSGAIALGSKLY